MEESTATGGVVRGSECSVWQAQGAGNPAHHNAQAQQHDRAARLMLSGCAVQAPKHPSAAGAVQGGRAAARGLVQTRPACPWGARAGFLLPAPRTP